MNPNNFHLSHVAVTVSVNKSFAAVNYFNWLLENQSTAISNAISCLCVWFCLHTILIKAKIWLRGSIPLLSPLIRQEGCQLWVLCSRLNSQTSSLNWTLELLMCMECLPCPALVLKFHREGLRTGERQEADLESTQQAACI